MKDIIWKIFLGSTLSAFLFFGVKTSLQIWEYSHLIEQAPAQNITYSIVPKNSSLYLIEASYHFEAQGHRLQGRTPLTTKPAYLNPWAAQEDIPTLAQKKWVVFYNAKNPQKNSLERAFPFKPLIHSLLSLAVFLYFLFLRNYFSRAYNIANPN